MSAPGMLDAILMRLMRTIVAGDAEAVTRSMAASPQRASARLCKGATREAGASYYLDEIGQHLYAGTTALHVAADTTSRES
jgi:hypothetical protein